MRLPRLAHFLSATLAILILSPICFAQVSNQLGDRDYSLYAQWINSRSDLQPDVHVYILDQTRFIDPLIMPCSKTGLPMPDASDAEVWEPLRKRSNSEVSLDASKLSAYLHPKVPYSIVSSVPPDAHGIVLQFTRIAFRDKRSEAGFVYMELKDGDEIIRGRLIFAHREHDSWAFVSPCEFVINSRDKLLMKALFR